MSFPFITVLIAIPLLIAIVLAFIPKEMQSTISMLSGVATLAALTISLVVWSNFDPAGGWQFIERYGWIPSWNVNFEVGIDGISLLMVLLTTVMSVIVLAYVLIRNENTKAMAIGILVMEASLIGVFAAIDLAVFYLFFELMLIPTWLLIGMYGTGNRRAIALKFFVYTLVGGFAMLGGVIYLAATTGSTSLIYLQEATISEHAKTWLGLAFLLSFGIKLPVFPFHTWQADTYTNAPVAVTVMLTALMAKIGAYGFLRLNVTLLQTPDDFLTKLVILLAVIGILYGAIVSAIQDDLKRLLAYSSLAHLGFVMLGTFSSSAIGLNGAVVQMFNHGITTGALFLMLGMLADRTGTTSIKELGGLLTVNPVYGGLFIFSAMSSIALPGLNGFVGEFPILLGSFEHHYIATTFATFGVVLAAVYMLWAIERSFMRETSEASQKMTALTRSELGILVPLMAIMLVVGLYPTPLYDMVDPAVQAIHPVQQAPATQGESN